MPDLLIGLLCRFMGSRFVVSMKNGFVSVIGRLSKKNQVQVQITVAGTKLTVLISVVTASGTTPVRQRSTTLPKFQRDAPFTSAVAAWVIPHISAVTGPSFSEPGIFSLKTIDRMDLLTSVAAFNGHALTFDSQGKAWSGKKNLVLWPRHMTVRTKKSERTSTFPISVQLCHSDSGEFQYTAQHHQACPGGVDMMVVDACRAAVLA